MCFEFPLELTKLKGLYTKLDQDYKKVQGTVLSLKYNKRFVDCVTH